MNLVARAKLVRHLTFPSPEKLTFTNSAIQRCNSYATKATSKKDEEFTGKVWNAEIGTSVGDNVILGVNNDEEFSRPPRDFTLELQWWEGCSIGEDLWMSFLEDPSKWWDNRLGKKNPNAPDFKHKETAGALWISSAPSWVLTKLEDLRWCVGKEAKVDDLWKSLQEDPSKWWDNRFLKTNPKAPDFVHRESKEALWVCGAPSWVLTKHETLESVEDVQWEGEKEAKGDDLWKSLLEDPSKWWDNRFSKTNPKAPDFVHKESKKELWVDSAPSWVIPEHEDLGSVKNAKREDVEELGGRSSQIVG